MARDGPRPRRRRTEQGDAAGGGQLQYADAWRLWVVPGRNRQEAHVGLGSGRVKLEMLGVSVVQVRQERGRDDTGRSRVAWLSVSQRKRTNRSPGCGARSNGICSVRQG